MSLSKNQIQQLILAILPKHPRYLKNGTEVIEEMRRRTTEPFSEASVRVYLSEMAKDPTSAVTRPGGRQGYYLKGAAIGRPKGSTKAKTQATAEIPEPPLQARRDQQLEEKFRAIYCMYERISNNLYPVVIDHTRATKTSKGLNIWKFPDVVLLEWNVGDFSDNKFHLDRSLLDLRRSLGEQPLRIISTELKVRADYTSFREDFFQCVSNSMWSHTPILAIACSLDDDKLEGELARLGASYRVSIKSYGLSEEALEEFPNAAEIRGMPESDFEKEIGSKISVTTVASAPTKDTIDWNQVADLTAQYPEFAYVFQWINYCIKEATAYTYDEILALLRKRGMK